MLYQITIPAFLKALDNLSHILDKGAQFAEQKKVDVEVLLQSRLAVDQFPLVRQVQIVCDTAKLCAARLTGQDAPSHADTEKSLPELKARIENVRSYLQKFSANDFETAASRHITQPRWDGQYLTGEEYVLHHVLPNLYFHLTTAYANLRHLGVEVGKRDYLGKMPFKR